MDGMAFNEDGESGRERWYDAGVARLRENGREDRCGDG